MVLVWSPKGQRPRWDMAFKIRRPLFSNSDVKWFPEASQFFFQVRWLTNKRFCDYCLPWTSWEEINWISQASVALQIPCFHHYCTLIFWVRVNSFLMPVTRFDENSSTESLAERFVNNGSSTATFLGHSGKKQLFSTNVWKITLTISFIQNYLKIIVKSMFIYLSCMERENLSSWETEFFKS